MTAHLGAAGWKGGCGEGQVLGRYCGKLLRKVTEATLLQKLSSDLDEIVGII